MFWLVAALCAACGHRPGHGERIAWTAVVLPEADPEVSARIAQYGPLVERAAEAHGLDPALVAAVVWVESRFDPSARSPAGAVGLMQLMPRTAREIGRRMGKRIRRRNPASNLDAGCFYLRRMLDGQRGNVRWALAAYHAGPGNAARYRRRGRMSEATARYVARVLEVRRRFAEAMGPKGLAGPLNAPRAPVDRSF
ncbi:MAG: lytic transglycosylase domain-containing protein [Deltaproteobacteria bacterium]|nr:MAG: lytic transglycosylase domain-containing protein [Deltaproteobacteria bacterium]